MKRLKLLGVFAGGLLLGAILVNWRWSHVLSTQTSSKSVDIAFRTAEQAEWLALLRLNEVTNLVNELENYINIELVTLAQWENASWVDKKSRLLRDRFLGPVKTYRQSYPASDDKAAGVEAAEVNALLARIPQRNPEGACKSAVCRLDDLRLRRSRPATNLPAPAATNQLH